MGKLRARTADEKDERQREVIRVAKEIFMELEYEDISLALIAKKLQITRPSLYNYFRSKEILFLELSRQGYLAMSDKLERNFEKKLETNEFCQRLTTLFLEDKLFIKLVSLHQTVMESKAGQEQMTKFKTETLPFFTTLKRVVDQQFPQATSESKWVFIMQLNVILPTFYNYTTIPQAQIDAMQKVGTFGNTELKSPVQFYSNFIEKLVPM
ncbi:TetR/AcrR family transcriptional regulator [Ligilactobacillus animalis]|nr:TetR/AcrR family transcriptional regulator [Ligilactobacillus animalis]